MTLYREWCTAIAGVRAKLEAARDARAGNLNNPQVVERFSQALIDFDQALVAHQNATGCQKMH